MPRIRVRHGENEIEVEGPESLIKRHLEAFYTRIGQAKLASPPPTLKKDIQEAASKRHSGKAPTPAEIYRAKNRTDGISQILIFGKYLEEYQGKSQFSRADINAVATEAKLSKDIHPQYFTNAIRQGLLRSLGGGKFALTLSAEDVLAAMK